MLDIGESKVDETPIVECKIVCSMVVVSRMSVDEGTCERLWLPRVVIAPIEVTGDVDSSVLPSIDIDVSMLGAVDGFRDKLLEAREGGFE